MPSYLVPKAKAAVLNVRNIIDGVKITLDADKTQGIMEQKTEHKNALDGVHDLLRSLTLQIAEAQGAVPAPPASAVAAGAYA